MGVGCPELRTRGLDAVALKQKPSGAELKVRVERCDRSVSAIWRVGIKTKPQKRSVISPVSFFNFTQMPNGVNRCSSASSRSFPS